MTPERWTQIEALFHRAVECDPERRVALLDDSCSDDPELRREVEALLSRDESARGHVRAAVHSEFKDIGYPLAGAVVSHYRILDGLGGGGMGLVYRAEDIRLGRLVALKFLPQESANNPVALARFEREARAVSAVEHPNICPIYEFGEHEGRPFLVMQLLEGQTLRELLENRRGEESKPGVDAAVQRNITLPLDQVLDLATQIADGLRAAHQKGIIHRDIKPANIFVTADGHAKILDFGLAKLTENVAVSDDDMAASSEEAGEPAQNLDPILSRTGVAIGTAAYMSPEQVRGEKLDVRTDLFSFGLVLYEMVTGRRAFVGDTRPALYGAILNQSSAPVRDLNPKLPVYLDRIINKALEKNREARYQTAAEIRADLETVKRAMEPRTLPARRVLASAAVLVLSLAGAIFWVVKRQLPYAAGVPDVKFQQLTINSADSLVTSGAISPDGKYLAYTDPNGMHIKPVGSDETQRVPEPEALKSHVVWEIVPTAWFPDSKRFLVNAHPANETNGEWSSQTSSIWMVSVGGGAPRRLRDDAVAWSISADGSLISFGTNKGNLGEREIWLMRQNGEQARLLYEAGRDNAICCLYFFPDGQRVSYISTDASGDTLVARDLNGGPVTALLPPSEMKKIGDVAWLPNGDLLYSDACAPIIMRFDAPCNIWTKRIDTHTGIVLEKPRRLTNWAGLWMNSPSVTADGKRVAFLESSSREGDYLADLEAGGRRLVNSRSLGFEEGQGFGDWTADSKTVLLVLERGDHYALRMQSLNSGTQETIVTSAPGQIEVSAVSPDEKWVILQVTPTPEDFKTAVQLMRVPMTGGSPESIFSIANFSSFACAKRPSRLCAVAEQTGDHKQMVITSFDPIHGRGSELARIDISPEFKTHDMNLLWSISFDGTLLAMAPGPEGPIEIRSMRGGPGQVIRPKGVTKMKWLAWAADGKALFVANTTSGAPEIMHVDLHRNTTVLWKCKTDRCFALPSPDGRHLAIDDWRPSANMWMMENF